MSQTSSLVLYEHRRLFSTITMSPSEGATCTPPIPVADKGLYRSPYRRKDEPNVRDLGIGLLWSLCRGRNRSDAARNVVVWPERQTRPKRFFRHAKGWRAIGGPEVAREALIVGGSPIARVWL